MLNIKRGGPSPLYIPSTVSTFLACKAWVDGRRFPLNTHPVPVKFKAPRTHYVALQANL